MTVMADWVINIWYLSQYFKTVSSEKYRTVSVSVHVQSSLGLAKKMGWGGGGGADDKGRRGRREEEEDQGITRLKTCQDSQAIPAHVWLSSCRICFLTVCLDTVVTFSSSWEAAVQPPL